MRKYFPELFRAQDKYFWLTALIIARNAIKREYQNSYLGVLWTVILPLIQVVIYSIIMPLILARPVDNYPLYLVASFPLWAFISSALVQSCNAILNQAETIKRCMVAPVIFPIADMMKYFYTYMISFLVMYVFCLMFYVDFDPIVLWAPVLLAPVFITMLALAIAIAFVAPYVRDVGYLMHMLVTLVFWFTPVVYPLSAVPEQYHWAFWLNPFYIMMHPVQQLFFNHVLPTQSDILALLCVMGVSIVISLILYRLCRRNYVYYL